MSKCHLELWMNAVIQWDNSDELCVVTQVIIASVVKRTNNVTKR